MKTKQKLKKRTAGIALACSFLFSVSAHSQMEDYADIIEPFLAKPIENGFMWFQRPVPLAPGECFEQYQIYTGDVDNNLEL